MCGSRQRNALLLPSYHRSCSRRLSGLGAAHPSCQRLQNLAQQFWLQAIAEVEYLELREEADLHPMPSLDRPARLLAAAWLGGTRLIDNVRLFRIGSTD
ncbi:pantoate--beta-alanine ligase [Mesorhizobium sp. M0618]|uniref:pantoate--beta-alanine ligase n=1 Tax=Mesorhizobium sp. M0618 TaxID=2956972 RepID=UPI00333BCFED